MEPTIDDCRWFVCPDSSWLYLDSFVSGHFLSIVWFQGAQKAIRLAEDVLAPAAINCIDVTDLLTKHFR